jgi:hypothetical protein
VAKTKSSRVVVGARLLHVVDNYLRRKQRGRGDMSALIYQALREVDLGSVQLITIQGQRRQVTARPTKIVLPTDVRDQLDRWSEARACSMNELLNSALVVSLLKPRPEKSGGRSRRGQTPTFDTMTAKQREDSLHGYSPSLDRNPAPTRAPEKVTITSGIQSLEPRWKWQAMVRIISWSEWGREKSCGLGNSREAHSRKVRKQGLGVTHDWTVKGNTQGCRNPTKRFLR